MRRASPFLRLVVPALVLSGSLAGCDRVRDLFIAHAETAAEAAGRELSSERLAQIMSSAKSVRPTPEAAAMVANIWLDYSLLGQAVARGEVPTDSASVAEAVWPQVAEILGTRWHDTLMARRSSLSPTAVDSLYNNSDQRLFQHILFGARANAPDTLRVAKRKQAQATLAQIKQGAGFGRLASRLSDDPGSKTDAGFLPLGPKGRFVASFDSAAWLLQPGEVSGLVETPYGYHILRRPALREVRERLSDHLLEQVGARLDSAYMDSLARANQVKLVGDAPALIRSAARSPGEAVKSAKSLVHFTGGALTTKDFIRWVNALPPQYSAQLQSADDAALKQFAKALAENALLLRDAEAGGVKVTSEEWSDLSRGYQARLDSLLTDMGLDARELTDAGVPLSQRQSLAAAKVEGYFDRLTDGKSRLRQMPYALATVLRSRLPFRLDDAGIARALELAKERAAAKQDSAGGPSVPPGAMRPAPGPAPIPGQQAPGVQQPPTTAGADSASRTR
jgi:parvulin-like peptidyl-prolyl cis-trans isomerase-like protein